MRLFVLYYFVHISDEARTFNLMVVKLRKLREKDSQRRDSSRRGNLAESRAQKAWNGNILGVQSG